MFRPDEATVKRGALIVLASLALACVWTMLLNRDSGRTVHSWEQPPNIDYWKNARYSLYVREKAPDWYMFGGRQRRHAIFIGWSDGYGAWFDCGFNELTQDDEKIDDYIRRCTVDWTADGVALKQPNGVVCFFPKEVFIGGR